MKVIKGTFLTFFTILTTFLVWSQTVPSSDPRCAGEVGCASCVSAGPTCAWCKQWGFLGPRCDLPEVLKAAGCPDEHVYLRGSSELRLKQDEVFSDFGRDEDEHAAVQVRPQSALVRLRAGDRSLSVPFTFRAARNYPLDVYFLMDATWSMLDDKETIANLGDDLAIALSNLTQNFRLGFGSYVDKPTMPFVDQARLSNPCSVEHGECSAAYGFHHHLSLNRDTDKFSGHVRDAPISGNLDNAEGGLDALMQTLACKEIVGWTQDSRKIVLLASDGMLHFAGDGKLGGAVRNNDGLCHLDPTSGLYTKSTEQDYPSLGQIDSKLLDEKVNVIFAVTRERLEHYARLTEVLQGPAFVAVLEEDSSNIIQLVRQGYQDIVSTVTFSDNATSPLRASYSTSCGGRRRTTDSSTCEEVQEGAEYEFVLHLQLDSCPAEPDQWRQQVAVKERGLVSGLSLEVDLLCGCDCESEKESTRCSSHGNLDCGVCHCHEGWFGPTCGCTGRNATTLPELDVGCLPAEVALRGVDVCWGRGDCVCGQCECHGLAHGRYCECDDSLCDRWGVDGARCGGAGRGRCVCGRCECEPGWEGASCACPSAKDVCIAPGDTRPCSGQGECVCGQCICGAADNAARFSGRYCEKCDTCRGLCELYQPCVLCKGFNHACPADREIDLCHTNSSDAYLDIVRELQVAEESEEELCKFTDPEDACQYMFSYRLDKQRKVRLRVLQTKTCSPPLNTGMVAGGIIVMVVLVGLLLILLYRVALAAKDKIAYQRFLEATKGANFEAGENPIYKPATTYYQVPQGYTGPVEPASPVLQSPTATSPL